MISGIKSGMVMQRGIDNTCKVFIETDEKITAVSCFDKEGKNYDVKIVKNVLTGIPVGGPYSLFINSEIYNNIYVGDVWILAGQSNMEGHGRLSQEDKFYKKNPNIRCFYMDDHWDSAKNPIHQIEIAVDRVHMDKLNGIPMEEGKGISPGLPFAIRMYELTGIPQGVIPCAHGGTVQEHWDPNLKALGGDGSLFGAMLRRFKVNGSHVRGVFWFQGCSDAWKPQAPLYLERCTYLFNEMRADMGTCPEEGVLPIVQVQIGRWLDYPEGDPNLPEFYWPYIRNVQLEMPKKIERLDTVASLCFSYSDGIHLDSPSQHKVGKKAADAMFNLIEPEKAKEKGILPGIKIDSIEKDDAGVTVRFLNNDGDLKATPVAKGFSLVKKDDFKSGRIIPCKAYVKKNEIRIMYGAECDNIKDYDLYYGFGMNPESNITDEAGNALPGFGPISL